MRPLTKGINENDVAKNRGAMLDLILKNLVNNKSHTAKATR